jgi:hypothetical protein
MFTLTGTCLRHLHSVVCSSGEVCVGDRSRALKPNDMPVMTCVDCGASSHP